MAEDFDPDLTDAGRALLRLRQKREAAEKRGIPSPVDEPTTKQTTELFIDPEAAAGDPDKANADLIRLTREDFEKRFSGLETELLDRAAQDGTPEADRAGEIALAQNAISRGTFERNLQRQGVGLTTEERAKVTRDQQLQAATDEATAKNTTRRGIEARNIDVQGQLVGQGRGILTSSAAGLSSSAAQANARESAFQRNREAAKQNDRAQTSQALGAAAGLAAAFILV